MPRKSTRGKSTREDQRRRILAIDALQNGERITAIDASRKIVVSAQVARKLLTMMVDEGLLNSHPPEGALKARGAEHKYSLPRSQLARRRWRRHTDEGLRIISLDGQPCYALPNPFIRPRVSEACLATNRNRPVELLPTGEIISEADVVSLCRAHFATFSNLQEAGDYYGLTDGRLSQIQNGIHVSCPRILTALGIKRCRGGDYRRMA